MKRHAAPTRFAQLRLEKFEERSSPTDLAGGALSGSLAAALLAAAEARPLAALGSV